MRTKNGIVVKHGIAPLLELQRKRNATHLVLRLEREHRAVISRMAGWQCEIIAPPTTPLAIPRHSGEHHQTTEFLNFSGEAGGQIRVELTSLWTREFRRVKKPRVSSLRCRAGADIGRSLLRLCNSGPRHSSPFCARQRRERCALQWERPRF